MSTKTTNYELIKPDQTDFYDVEDFNNNMDKIDEEIKKAKEKIKMGRSASKNYFPLVLTDVGDGTTTQEQSLYAPTNNTITVHPADGKIKANTFEGDLTGTANYANNLTTADITENTDLNNVKSVGFHKCRKNATAATLSNCPTTWAFFMIVGVHACLYQEITTYSRTPQKYIRSQISNDEWSEWIEVSTQGHTHNSIQINRSASPDYFPILLTNTGDGTTIKQDNIYAPNKNTVTINPGNGAIKATKFEGNLVGNMTGVESVNYSLVNTTSGWYRIANIPYSAGNYIFQIQKGYNTSRFSTVQFALNVNGAQTPKVGITQLQGIIYSDWFSKVRVIYDDTKSTSNFHVEIHVGTGTSEQFLARVIHSTTETDILLTEATAGNIPSGYTSKEFEFTTNTLKAENIVGNIAASNITAGTLLGQVKANTDAVASVGVYQVRNIAADTADLTAGTSSLTTGSIYLVYE